MTQRVLHVGKDLTLPKDAVTQTFAIFGKRGSGKTNGATVLVEELLKVNLPVVVLDPVDAWWGLKSSLDGKGTGFPIYIFGGPHGDLPLEPTAGALIADMVSKEQIPLVLSMKMWGVGERARFVTDFAKRLLQINQDPLMMVLEEADAFIPQRPAKGEEAMLGAMDRLVRWGRQSGVGCTIVTQRSAKVNKDVTTQAETLIAFRTTGPQDRDAIDAWIRFHAGDEKRDEVLSTLPTLPNGTAWVWSPEWLEIFERIAFRRRETFDSAATPKVGEDRPKPKRLAEVDLERLRGQMAATFERAKADDPRELRRQIAELRKELAAKPKPASAVQRETKAREIQILKDGQLKRLESAVAAAQAVSERLVSAADGVSAALFAHRPPLNASNPMRVVTAPPAPILRHPAPRPRPGGNGDDRLSLSQQRILDSLAWLEGVGINRADKTQVALLADQSPTSGGYFNNLGRLRSSGLIDYPAASVLALTEEGRTYAKGGDVPSSSAELQEQLYRRLSRSQAEILKKLVGTYPDDLGKDDLAQLTGQSPTSGGYFNNLGRLRSLGLIDYPIPGRVVATAALFLER